MANILEFHIPSMTCGSCVNVITNYLQANKEACQFEKISLDEISKKLVVCAVAEANEMIVKKKIEDTISEIGHECVFEKVRTQWQSYLAKGLIGILLGAVIVVISILLPGLPFWGMCLLVGLSSLCTFVLGVSTYYAAIKQIIKAKTLTMDSLLTVSTFMVVGVTVASLFFPALPMMAEIGLFIFGFKFFGKSIEEYTKEKMIEKTAIENQSIKSVQRKVRDVWHRCDVNALNLGDIIKVYPNEVIPVDCAALNKDGDIFLYQTIQTGSPFPEKIKDNTLILAGMRVPEDSEPMTFIVTKQATASYLAIRAKALDEAREKHAPLQDQASQLLRYFIPVVVGLALLSGIVIGICFNPALAVQCAISVLVSVCPCTLGFITPFAFHLGMQKAALHGVQFKSGEAIQKASECDTVVLDFNGTLTRGEPVVRCHQYDRNEISEDKFWQYLYTLEASTTHKIGQAIFTLAKEKISKKESEETALIIERGSLRVNQSHHAGISATINDEEILLGNRHYLTGQGISCDRNDTTHAIYLVRNKAVIGSVTIEDPLKEDAKIAIDALRETGKTIYIASGLETSLLMPIADSLGIPRDNVRGNQSPDNKVQLITELSKAGKKVAMIGDGGNDVTAMAASHFGLAMQSALTDVETKTHAHAVMTNESLAPLVTTFVIAKQTLTSIKQNLFFSLSYNMLIACIAGGALVAVGFALNPALGIGLMVLQMGLLLANQYRLRSQLLPHLHAFQAEKREATPVVARSSHARMHAAGMTVEKEAMTRQATKSIGTTWTAWTALTCCSCFSEKTTPSAHESYAKQTTNPLLISCK